MKTQLLSAEHIKEAAALLRKGGLVVFPTETVYGLGASAFNPVACGRIFSAKGRPSDNPLIVHVGNAAQLDQVAGPLTGQAGLLAQAFWPGPLTLVVPKRAEVPEVVTAGLGTVAVRWPRHPLALAFLEACGVPVAAPSANVSGAPSPTTFDMAKGAMLGRVDAIVAGEDCEVGLESTIVGFVDGQAKILRPGGLGAEDLARVLGVAPAALTYHPPVEGRPVSPGLKYTHYKPHAEVRLFGAGLPLDHETGPEQKVGLLALGAAPDGLPPAWTVQVFDSVEAYAHGLFATFFAWDRQGRTVIWAQVPPEAGLGAALLNRLRKAAGLGAGS